MLGRVLLGGANDRTAEKVLCVLQNKVWAYSRADFANMLECDVCKRMRMVRLLTCLLVQALETDAKPSGSSWSRKWSERAHSLLSLVSEMLLRSQFTMWKWKSSESGCYTWTSTTSCRNYKRDGHHAWGKKWRGFIRQMTNFAEAAGSIITLYNGGGRSHALMCHFIWSCQAATVVSRSQVSFLYKVVPWTALWSWVEMHRLLSKTCCRWDAHTDDSREHVTGSNCKRRSNAHEALKVWIPSLIMAKKYFWNAWQSKWSSLFHFL